MKLKSITAFLVFMIIFSAMAINASAETEGIFDYYDEGDYGYSMIAKCNDAKGKVVIPSTLGGNPVVTIHDKAFENATEMTAIVIPKSISGIYANSFEGCVNLKDIYYEGSASDWNKIQIGFESEVDGGVKNIPLLDAKLHLNGDEDITPQTEGIFDYVIENGNAVIMKCNRSANEIIEVPEKLYGYPVTEIGTHAFFNCSEIEEIVLPETVTKIGGSAFSYCSKLKKINLPDSITEIKYHAFVDCISLEEIVLPEELTEVSYGLFMRCSNLKSVRIPPSVKTINYRAFAWCDSLSLVELSKGLETISEGAFSYTAISELNIPEGVTKLDIWSVTYCENLKSVAIPESVTEIGINAFEGCKALSDIYYQGSEAEWQNIDIVTPNENLLNANIHYSSTEKFKNESAISENVFDWLFPTLIAVITVFVITVVIVIKKKKAANAA